ncbi:respiratory nitrate reductase subunit gamma [Aquibacillus halophilus]|nr:respiratory nitrate reductase subunit gamma [Aquibacillus halophilus]
MVESLLGVILPFSSIAIFVMGLIWQYEDKDSYRKGFVNMLCVSLGIVVLITGVISLSQITIFKWMSELFLLNITVAPLIIKMHVLSLCSLLIVLPFTRFIKLFNIFKLKRYTFDKVSQKVAVVNFGKFFEWMFQTPHQRKNKAELKKNQFVLSE